MAKKKSALSKGYRKTAKQQSKAILTKKEIFIMIAIVAAIALAIILFELLHDDGYLVASQVEQNDIVTWPNKESKNRFVKLGEANDFEGYDKELIESDASIRSINYTNTDESSPVESFYVSGSFVNASDLSQTTLGYLGGFTGENFTELKEIEVQGHKAYVFSYTYDYYNDPDGEEAAAKKDEEHESDTFCQDISCYIKCWDNYTMGLHIKMSDTDDSYYIPEDGIEDYVLQFSDAFTLVDPDAKEEAE